MTKKIISTMAYLVLIIGLILGLINVVQAATGNIDPVNKWVWGGNAGWLNFNPSHGGVTVYDDHLEGYAWAENIGWVRLGTYSGGGSHTYANTAAGNYGVNNDGSGNLSGYAWSANAGWINFNPSDGQVTIEPATGEFDGYAWAENVGWIHFKNAGANAYSMITAWQKHDYYLPLVFKNFVSGPDLVVDSLVASSSAITLTLRNAGTTATRDDFWVNVYFNPNPAPPGLNQTWQSSAPAGANWGVTARLNPGETLILTLNDTYYVDGSSSFPAGANVYAYVDSLNYATTSGNVLESNEDNNVFGPVVSTVGVAGAVGPQNRTASLEGLPER